MIVMKTKILTTIICACAFVKVQAQDFLKSEDAIYLSENSRWTEYLINIQSNFVVSKLQYWISGDTIINEQTYKKVVGDAWSNGFIREDNGKIYAIFLHSGVGENEFLLYDFTVQIGDIITSTARYGVLAYPLTVIQIDEITLETGEKRKRFFLDFEAIWIEGIGSINGLFSDVTDYVISSGIRPRLVCFKQEDAILYQNEELCQSNNCCDDISAGNNIGTINTSTVTTTIIQNNNQIIIDFPETFSGETIIRLHNATGHFVFTKTTTQDSLKLNIADYPNGIYVISIQNGSNVEYLKLIK